MRKQDGSRRPGRRAALLLIDVINDMAFEGAERLVQQAVHIVEPLARLKARARRSGTPVIYVNDNFGHWQSDFRRLVRYCTTADVPGRVVAQGLQPSADDYFVLKPKHSAFFGTTLDTLLVELGVERLVLTGIAANICVLFTAHDAHMRGYPLHVPADCVASNTPRETQHALEHLRTVIDATISPSTRVRFSRLPSAASRAVHPRPRTGGS